MSEFLAAAQADAQTWLDRNATAISDEELDLWASNNRHDAYFAAFFSRNPHSYYMRTLGFHMRRSDPVPAGVLRNCRMGLALEPDQFFSSLPAS